MCQVHGWTSATISIASPISLLPLLPSPRSISRPTPRPLTLSSNRKTIITPLHVACRLQYQHHCLRRFIWGFSTYWVLTMSSRSQSDMGPDLEMNSVLSPTCSTFAFEFLSRSYHVRSRTYENRWPINPLLIEWLFRHRLNRVDPFLLQLDLFIKPTSPNWHRTLSLVQHLYIFFVALFLIICFISEQFQGKSSVGMAPITDSNGNGTIKSNLYVPSGMGKAEDALRQAINKNTGATIGRIPLNFEYQLRTRGLAERLKLQSVTRMAYQCPLTRFHVRRCIISEL